MSNEAYLNGPEKELMLKDRILNYIVLNKLGVNILELEKVFGEPRMRLGYVINMLLEEGKIQKSSETYVAIIT